MNNTKQKSCLVGRIFVLEKPNDLDAAVKNRKKVVATVCRPECVYKRTGKPSVPFCEKGGTAV